MNMLTLAQAANGTPAPPVLPDADVPMTTPLNGEAQTLEGGTPLPDPAREQQGSPFGSLIFFVAIIAIFWWILIRGQRKEKKKREAVLSSIKKGDRVSTIGGIIGTLTDVREDEVIVKVDENNNVKIRFARSAIQAVLNEKPDA